MVTAALNGDLEKGEFVQDPYCGISVPTACEGVPAELLIPEKTWEDKAAYEAAAKKLAQMFRDNFAKYTNMPEEIVAAGPRG